jgi:hypothetical protein
MSQEDIPIYMYVGILVFSSSASAYLWFVKKLRSGALIWTLYGVRALCGALAIGAAVMGWDILIEAADVPAVLVFVGPIGLVGLLCVVLWGIRRRAPVG